MENQIILKGKNIDSLFALFEQVAQSILPQMLSSLPNGKGSDFINATPIAFKDYYTIGEVCDILNVTKPVYYTLLVKHNLKREEKNGRWEHSYSEVERLKREYRKGKH